MLELLPCTKNKGDRSDFNNYHYILIILLLSIVGKLFARVILSRLQELAARIYPESQSGFRSDRSTMDMIFSVRQLQEKCREQNMPLYMTFYLVSREARSLFNCWGKLDALPPCSVS